MRPGQERCVLAVRRVEGAEGEPSLAPLLDANGKIRRLDLPAARAGVEQTLGSV
jgi:hypothetical protein